MIKFLLILAFTFIAVATWGQSKVKKEKNVRILPFPIASYSPETRLLYGAGVASTFRLHPADKKENPSVVNGFLAHTQNNQFLIQAQYQIFNKNKQYHFGEIGYYKFNFFYYGLGQNEVPEESYDVDFPRIKFNVVQRINSKWMLGGGLHYEDYKITKKIANTKLLEPQITGANGSRLSGLGAISVLDTRDSVFFPNKGAFGNFSLFHYNKAIGGSHNFSRLVTDFAFYKKFSKRINWATQWYNAFTFGDVPFQAQAQLGGQKLMRGLYQGRFTDKNASMLQTEGRINFYKRWSGAVFATTAVLGNENDFLRLNDFKFAYGAGLRFTFNRKDHLNIRVDYAKGDKGFFYFTIGEAF